MGGFVSSTSGQTRHDVFGIERTPPAVIRALGTGKVILVCATPWGPDGEVHQPADAADRMMKFAPPGMDHLSSGYLAMIQKAWTDLRIIRVLGTAAAKAVAILDDTGADCITVTAKYKGVAGNSISLVVSDASDGDVNHFNLTATITGASGSYSETFPNLNYSGTGSDSVPSFTQSYLLSAIAKVAAGRPDNGTFTMATGADGAIDAGAYTGTASTGNKGIALAETQKGPLMLITDDPGDTIRPTSNAAVLAQAATKRDRVGIVNGDSGLALSAVQTDKATYTATAEGIYVDGWVYIHDDVDGSEQLVPPGPFLASVLSQLSPSTSPAWKDEEVGKMLAGIVRLETPRGDGAGSNTEKGIVTLIAEEDGGHRFEAGVVMCAPSTPAKRNITRTRMGHYMVMSVTTSLRPSVDAPSVPLNQMDVVMAIDRFGRGLKAAQNTDPNHTPHLLDWRMRNLASFNTANDLNAGKFTVPADAKTSPAMEQIFFSVQYGETVEITAE